jgi:hypothetical protein
MSPPGRPKGELRSAQHEGASVCLPGQAWRVASQVLAMHEHDPCGDAAAWHPLPETGGGLLAIIDGLGHGAEAARAAQAALQVLAAQPGLPLPQLLALLDAQLAGLRGAAVGLLRVRPGALEHAGIGNTRAMRLRAGQLARLGSQNGIVGGGLPQPVQINQLDLQASDWLLLFTDGLDEMLQLPVLLPEWSRDPATLCTHLLRQWRSGRDDAGVLVLQVLQVLPAAAG